MKLAVVSFCFNCPTGRRDLQALQTLSQKNGLEVHILTVDRWGHFNDKDLNQLGTEWLKICKLRTFFHGRQARYIIPGLPFKLLRLKPDLIYAIEESTSNVTFISLIMAKILRVPFWFCSYRNIYRHFLLPLDIIEKMVLRYSDGIIAVTDDAKEILTRKGADDGKIEVLPHTGIDTQMFRPFESDLNKRVGFEKEETILFIGRLVEEKGINTILEAREILRENGGKYKYLFVGSGDLSQKLKTLESESDIKVIDWMESSKLPNIYNSGAIFLYPSIPTAKWVEQFGYSMVEALSCEVPVIASDVSGPKAIIEQGKTGFLIEPNNAQQLAEKITLLMGNKELRGELGKRGRVKVIEHFSNNAIAKRLFELLIQS